MRMTFEKDLGMPGKTPVSGEKPSLLDALNASELADLRSEIDQRLNLGLKQLDMDAELSLQYRQAKALYAKVQSDNLTAANQKAQVLNTISAVLRSISETSERVYSVERLKKLEAATLAAVRDLPEAPKAKFFELFKEYLELD